MKRIFCILLLVLTVVAVGAADKKFTLVIDAGHGGHDTGAPGATSYEKNLTLRMALAFGQMVERNCPDVKVIYTRKTDVYLTLKERAELANRNKADLFVSIHINSIDGGKLVRGFQTYTLGRSIRNGNTVGIQQNLEVAKRENSVIFLEKDYKQTYQGFDANSPESNIMFEFIQDNNRERSVDFAKMLMRTVCQATGRNNMGSHQDNLAVLRQTSMPACLLELGFISTPDEEAFLNSKEAPDLYARGIYNAFVEYKNKYYSNLPQSYKVDVPKIEPKPQPVAQQPRKEESRTAEATPAPVKESQANTPQKNTTSASATTPQKASATPAPAKPATATTPSKTAPAKQNTETSPAKQTKTTAAKPASTPQKTPAPATTNAVKKDQPVFKVQVLASSRKLRPDDAHFKGMTGFGSFEENNMTKYTYGESVNYNEIARLRKQILEKFPEAFIIAFKNGKKMDVNEAIREFLNNKGK